MTKKYFILLIIALVVLATTGAAAYKLTSDTDKTDSSKLATSSSSTEATVVDGPAVQNTTTHNDGATITVEGTYGCLEAANATGPQTMECALGMKTDDGTQYGLSDPDHSKLMGIPTGQRIRVTGTVSANQSAKYLTAGTIAITTLEKL